MKLYDILKAAKNSAVPDVFTTLRAQIAPFAKGGSTPAEKELEDTPPLSYLANGDPLIAWTIKGNLTQSGIPSSASPIMAGECGDLIETGEHSGEYVISITNGGETTLLYTNEPIRKIGDYIDYKSESVEYRIIGKKVYNGTETSWHMSNGFFYDDNIQPDYLRSSRTTLMCSHYKAINNVTSGGNVGAGECAFYSYSGVQRLYIKDDNYSTIDDFKSFLAEQYSNGTPVTVWYVMSEPTTESIESPAIATNKGSNTLSVGTTVQPSSVYIKYKG